MATKIPEAEAPTPLKPTDEHRVAARARGSDLDQLLSLLRSGIGDVTLLLREIIASVPKDDGNLAILKAKLALFQSELNQLKP